MRFADNPKLALILLASIGSLSLFVHPAISQTPYYAGKTIIIVRGGGAGGSGEFQSRALMPYLKKYIPGNPTIMMEFMDGGAGRKAANYLYTAKPDGLKIGSPGNMLPGPILGLPGSNYDIDKFIYIGSTETGNPYAFFTRKAAGLDSLDKLRNSRGVRIGAHSVGHSVYITARMFALLLDLRNPDSSSASTIPKWTSPSTTASSTEEPVAISTACYEKCATRCNFTVPSQILKVGSIHACRVFPTSTPLPKTTRNEKSSTFSVRSKCRAGRTMWRRGRRPS